MKKILFLILAFNLNIHADTPDKSSHSTPANIHIGIGLGVENQNIEAHLKINPSIKLGRNLTSTTQHSYKKNQIFPYLEFGKVIYDDFYIALTASFHYYEAQNTSRISLPRAYFFLHQFKLKSYTDILVKAGYKPTQHLLIYGLLGPSFATWSHTTQLKNTLGLSSDEKLVDTFDMKQKTVGLGIGCGVDFFIKNKYALSFEYVCHKHRNKSKNFHMTYNNTIDQTRSAGLVKTVQPYYSTFAIRFTYYFNPF